MAGIQIASLFATIGAKTDGLDKGLNQSKKSLEGFGSKVSSIAGTVAAFTAAAAAAGVAMKKVYDGAKAAANLEYAKTRFDNLTTSIGSTSDALMDDLRDATHGMISDAELVASAGDLMALGLAKSHDEVVRLTNVAGALNMNMNQLVLTLTNQTTMRFDALGVSVAGFDEKVKALEASGLSAQDAFTGAFLQQAEEQIGAVGSATDSAIGSFARFEASTTNLKNALLQELLPAITPIVEGLTDIFSAGDLKQRAEESLNIMRNYGAITREEYDYAMLKMADATMNVSDRVEFYNSIIEKQTGMMGYFAEKTLRGAGAVIELSTAVNATDLSAAREEYMATASVLKEELAGAYDAVRTAEENWRSGVAGKIKSGLDKELENRTISTEEYAEALGRLDAYAGTQFAYEFKIEENIPDLVKSLLTDPEGFMSKMSGFEDAMMPLDTSVKNAMELVAELQGQLEDLEREYSAYVNIKVRQLNGGLAVGNTSEWAVPHGTHASGGYAVSNTPYIVGERGPEVFVPNANGQIVSNDMAFGGGSDLLTDILLELQSQPSRMKVAMKEAMALVGG